MLCNSAGEPLNTSVVPHARPGRAEGRPGRVDQNQWETGSIGGVQGFQVWLDGRLIAGVPTRADGPGLGGHHALSIDDGA